MGFLDWVRGIFRPSIRRSIVRLDPGSGAPLDASEEVVELTVGPLREHSQRMTVRDRRLLPKRKPVARSFFGFKKKRILPTDEANRLFAKTMRTRNRSIRDLAADEKQLKRYGLPLWRTEEELATALGLTTKQLRFFSVHREGARVTHSVTFRIPKRSGGTRVILAPKKQLKALQRRLLNLLVSRLPVSEHAHGFVKKRSIRTGAEPHAGKAVVLRIDLADFFPSVTFPRVRGLLIGFGYSYPVATTLAVLMTEAERQPVEIQGVVYHVPVGPRHCAQGAPTSPAICNAIVARLDRRLAGVARKHGFAYTRYADDLTFSGNDRQATTSILGLTRRIVEEEGFKVNHRKTRVMGRGGSQRVTNVVVNDVVGASRRERRKLRAALHHARTKPLDWGPYRRLQGRVAFVSMLNAKQAESLRRAFAALPKPAGHGPAR